MNGKYPRLEKVLADQGFDGEEFTARIAKTFGFILEIVKKVLYQFKSSLTYLCREKKLAI